MCWASPSSVLVGCEDGTVCLWDPLGTSEKVCAVFLLSKSVPLLLPGCKSAKRTSHNAAHCVPSFCWLFGPCDVHLPLQASFHWRRACSRWSQRWTAFRVASSLSLAGHLLQRLLINFVHLHFLIHAVVIVRAQLSLAFCPPHSPPKKNV